MTRSRLLLSTEPRRATIALVLLTLAAAAGVVAPSASAGKPSAPAPTSIATAIEAAVTTSLPLPDASGSPAVLIEQGVPFTVTAELVDADSVPTPYSTKTATTLTISITSGTGTGAQLDGTVAVDVDPGMTQAVFPDLVLTAEDSDTVLTANDVQLTVRATAPAKAAKALDAGSTPAFDVVRDAESIPLTQAEKESSLQVSAGGKDVICEATPLVQTCVDVLLPNGVNSSIFFSTGSCVGAGCTEDGRDLLQVLVDLDLDGADPEDPADDVALYSKTSPATVVFRCDKTLCGGGGVPKKELLVNLSATGDLTAAPACPAKNVVGGEQDFCVDYTQSKRDGSGDTYLYLLLIKDVRMSF